MPVTNPIVPCLWFADEGEEAAKFYTGIFKNSRINAVTRYGTAGQEIHGRLPGSVMTVEFELEGQKFMALNAGPVFTFNEAISFFVGVDTQAEIDDLWDKLIAGGGSPSRCGWLKDKYGLSWQIVPNALGEMLSDKDPEKSGRCMNAMLQMAKLDVAKLRAAFNGE